MVKFVHAGATHLIPHTDNEYRARLHIQRVYPQLAGTGYILLDQKMQPPVYPLADDAKINVVLPQYPNLEGKLEQREERDKEVEKSYTFDFKCQEASWTRTGEDTLQLSLKICNSGKEAWAADTHLKVGEKQVLLGSLEPEEWILKRLEVKRQHWQGLQVTVQGGGVSVQPMLFIAPEQLLRARSAGGRCAK